VRASQHIGLKSTIWASRRTNAANGYQACMDSCTWGAQGDAIACEFGSMQACSHNVMHSLTDLVDAKTTTALVISCREFINSAHQAKVKALFS
jgi:hypothetical protein